MRRKTIIRLTFWVTMVLWFGGGFGCASHNESNRLARAAPAPAFADSPALEFTGEASLTGLDRSAWPTTRIQVMNNDAVTDPVYWVARQLNSRPSPRSLGQYPTVDSVLELHDQAETIQAHYLEIFTEPLHQLINIGAFPARPLGRRSTARHGGR